MGSQFNETELLSGMTRSFTHAIHSIPRTSLISQRPLCHSASRRYAVPDAGLHRIQSQLVVGGPSCAGAGVGMLPRDIGLVGLSLSDHS